MNYLKPIILHFIMTLNLISAQTNFEKTPEYRKALEALLKKDTTAAITFFKESIKQNNDASSYFQLAKLAVGNKTDAELNTAFDFINKAVELDSKNVEYLLLMASIREELYYVSRNNLFELTKAKSLYDIILQIDPRCMEAWYNVGRLKGNDFLEYQFSEIKQIRNNQLDPINKLKASRKGSTLLSDTYNEFNNAPGNFVTLKYSRVALRDFNQAEQALLKAIEIDQSPIYPYLELSKLYLANDKLAEAENLLLRLKKTHPMLSDVYLFLGLIYYTAKENGKASNEFETAISLMDENHKQDFTINSVKLLFLSKLGDRINEMSPEQLLPFISKHWETKDPLYLTPYNERLLEHYSRFAYANIFFGSRRLKIDGWNTDRGELLLRYGWPSERILYRTPPPKIERDATDEDSKAPLVLTEVWHYPDRSFAFTDQYRNKNYQFAQPWNSQSPLNTSEEIISLRKSKPEEYIPKFEGPVFDLNYQVFQFASKNKSQTDVYLAYGINFSDTSTTKDKFTKGYDVGLFMFDKNFNKQVEKRKTYAGINGSLDYAVNSIEMTLPPQSGDLAFEMMRKKDKGVTAYHGKYNIKNYSGDELKISDVILASDIETDQQNEETIKRNNVSILPDPTSSFNKNEKLFLYYEIYNLKINTNNLTDFEQKITIQRKKERGVLNSLLGVVGLDKEGKKVALTSKYQTQEKDPQMYLQLDMSNYEPGEYVITVSIKDLLTGKEVNGQTEINWK